jgi:hypothetical protein
MATDGRTGSGWLTRVSGWRTAALLVAAVGVAIVLDLAVLATDEPRTSGATAPTAPPTAVVAVPSTEATVPVVVAPPATQAPPPSTAAASVAQPPAPPPTPTATVPIAEPEVLAYAVPGDAGQVLLARSAAGIELAGVAPAPGWTYEVDRDEHDRIEVEFVNGATGEEREWELEADDEGVEIDD